MVDQARALKILEVLKGKIPSLSKNHSSASPEFQRWRGELGNAIENIFPGKSTHRDKFSGLNFCLMPFKSVTDPGVRDAAFQRDLGEADVLLHVMLEEIRTFWSEDGTSIKTLGQQAPANSAERITGDPRKVFVVHGRNGAARKSMFDFLRAIGLRPLEWSQICAATGDSTPYIGQVLDKAFSLAQAVVVLMTPDDEAWLKTEFQSEHDENYEKQLTPQARPNVLFEAGMAMGRNASRTVLVQIGTLRPFSDIGGRHMLRLTNTVASRQELAQRLKTAGCEVDLTGPDWHEAGSFDLSGSPT
jgi:predicted nucleotide-binding protein